MLISAVFLLLAIGALATPISEIVKRQSCPDIHIFGARETTAAAGYGSSSTVVNEVLSAYSGSTAEAIDYPACGGQASCGSVSYANSVVQGIQAVASAVNAFNTQCPDTLLVLVGYSQVSGRSLTPTHIETETVNREVRSLTMRFAAEATLQRVIPVPVRLSKPLLSHKSRLLSLWETLALWQGFRTRLGHAKLKAYVSHLMLLSKIMLIGYVVCCPSDRFLVPFGGQDPILLRLG